MHCPKLNFTRLFTIIAIASVTLFFLSSVTFKAQAATGINRQINFQGKLVNNPLKTNVSDTSYTVVFTLYDAASGGTSLWTETQTVTTVDGIFRVALGSVTPIPANFNFNWSGLYLGMKVNADSEMTPRVAMAAVPFAFNAEKVAGLTVQDTSGNASTSGTLQIANGKTFNLGNNNLTFTTSGDTTLTLPTSGTVTALGNTTTGTGTTLVLAGNPSFAAITLSSGAITLGGTTGTASDCIKGGSTASWGSCGTGGGTNWWNQVGGLVYPTDSNYDFAVGGTATSSALFSYTGIQSATHQTIASISGILNVFDNNGYGGSASLSAGLVLGAKVNPIIQTTNNQPITIGGGTTGNIYLMPRNGNGNVGIGTTNPTYPLSITSNTGWMSLDTVGSGVSGGIILNSLGTQKGIIATNVGGSNFLSGSLANSVSINSISGPLHLAGRGDVLQGITISNGTTSKGGGYVGIGLTAPIAELHVSRSSTLDVTGKALVIFDQIENQDILTASYGGTTKFALDNAGNLKVVASSGLDVLSAGTLNIGVTTANALVLGNSTVSTLTQNVDTAGNFVFQKEGSAFACSGTDKLTLNGSGQLICSTDVSGGGSGVNWWNQVGGLVYPTDSTYDFAVGSSATSSALFSYTGIQAANHQTIASISGKLIIMPNNGYTNVGIGTTDPIGVLDVLGKFRVTSLGQLDLVGNLTSDIDTLSATKLTIGGSTANQLVLGNNTVSSLTLNVDTAGNFVFQKEGSAFSCSGTDKLTLNGSGQLICSTDVDTDTVNANWWNQVNGVIYPTNINWDFAVGGNSTASAEFSFTGVLTGKTIASVSGNLVVNDNNGYGGSASLSAGLVLGAKVASSAIQTTSNQGLTVGGNTTGEIIFSPNGGTGKVTIGSATNGLVYDIANGGTTYFGTGRPTKQIVLSPEYAGAVLTASGSATTNGTMISDASASAALSNFTTFYEWNSTQNALQDYTVAVRVTLPQDFSDWDSTSNNAMKISFDTAVNNSAVNKLDVAIYNADTSLTKPGNPVILRQANTSTAKTWTTINIDRSDFVDNAEAITAAGKTMIIYLRMYASGTYNYTQVGDIVINYKAKF